MIHIIYKYRLLLLLSLVCLLSSCHSSRRAVKWDGESLPVVATAVSQSQQHNSSSGQAVADRVIDWHKINVAGYFNDVQSVQKQSAIANGITPQEDDKLLKEFVQTGELYPVKSNSHYQIATLTHSYPYLVPKAIQVIDEIGIRVQQITGTRSRIIVTSLLRTKETQSKLQRVNANAASFSCHYYGTTFDIAYNRLEAADGATQEQLFNALCQAVFEMRLKNRLWVKYEFREHCLHCTVR